MATPKGSPRGSLRAASPIEARGKSPEPSIHLEKHEAYAADEAEHKLTMGQAFKSYYKAVIWSATLSMALVMESYGTLGPATPRNDTIARVY